MQKQVLRKTITLRQRKCIKTKFTRNNEQGIALVMALLMGVALVGGATALMVRMLGARKVSASESYQQLAEAAAVNGFNRILATLNGSDKSQYLGYLYLINNNPTNRSANSSWASLPTMEEPCSAKFKSPPDWQSVDVALQKSGNTLREDIAGNVRTYYRLRRYVGPGQTSSAEFEIEGIVKREGSTRDYEARSLLRRKLFINSRVPTENDWAVLAARNFQLNDLILTNSGTTAQGGMIINLLSSNSSFNTSDPDACSASNLLALVGASGSISSNIANHIWPVKNINNNNWDIPSTEYFNLDNTTDTPQSSSATRIWSFDDEITGNPLEGIHGIECGGTHSPVCSRPSNNNSSNPPTVPISNERITSTIINKTVSGQECVNKKTWGNKGQYKIGEVYTNSDQCNSQQQYWKNRVEWMNTAGSIAEPTYTITLKESDLCSSTSGVPEGNVCHVFIEHLNLKRSRLFIENSKNRPIVLHLETPAGAARRSDLDGKYSLSGGSKLCGIDVSIYSNQTTCNLHSERLVIVSSEGDATRQCYNNSDAATLKFGGNNIPAAMINMPNGNVELNSTSTSTKAVIWANSICMGVNQRLSLSTNGSDGSTAIIKKAEEQWQWPLDKRYGRTVVRGIRGTGFDTFSRW